MRFGRLIAFVVACLHGGTAFAAPLEVRKVADNVYAIVGELEQRSPGNLGNNATFGAVVTAEGVVLIDSGGSHKGAAELDHALRTVTDKPVIVVINSGGQDHRWMGNGYFKDKGARIVASAAAVEDQKKRADMQFQSTQALLGVDFASTIAVHADQTFADRLDLNVGGVAFELRHVAHAHTPGDSFVWLPDSKVVFTGDIIYLDRMLGVGLQSDSGEWIKAFDAMAALQPEYVIPGHGYPGSLAKARAETRDYLAHLRTQIRLVIDQGGDMVKAGAIDQTGFAFLKVSDQIGGRNALRVFEELEFE